MLRVRRLGRVPYAEADALQRALHERATDDYLLLLEHPHVYTLGTRATLENVLVPPASVGAELVRADRGGDVTYHGPGQLVGYPIVTLAEWRNGQRDVVAYVRTLEAVLVDVLADLGITARTEPRYTGVWVGDRKIAAIGVRIARGRTRHGFALNVDPDLAMFGHIVPCGIRDRGVTSIAAELAAAPDPPAVADLVATHFARHFGYENLDRQDVTATFFRFGVAEACTTSLSDAKTQRPERPEWMRVKVDLGEGYRDTKRLVKGLGLHTVCEEAGCPNIYECWADRTATFMILGDRCTRACGFCLVDTRKPRPLDPDEPGRVAEAIAALGLQHAVITSVARDDVPDGGAAAFAATIAAVRARTPATRVEVLVPDCKGRADALDAIFAARPDVLNHNLETVARLQRRARPSAGYARSLALLARAKTAGLTTKSGIILGMGETEIELRGAIADLRNVGVDILTLGQYLQPSAQHLPVARWWSPAEFAALGEYAEGLGFAHVEAGPLVRSSYHARRADASASAVARAG
jgi:lipoic acid synthetase